MKVTLRGIRAAATIGTIMAISSGCAHPLVIKNIDSYRVSDRTSMTTPKSIGVVSASSSFDDQILINGVSDSLRRYSSNVVSPYIKGGDRKVDIIANIDLQSQYDGSGINFLISWPGFILWTPAWNGYIYNIKHSFSVRIEDGSTLSQLDSFNVPIDLDIRHAAMNRTWLAESGWWLFYTIPSFVGGILHTEYDRQVTPLAAKEAAMPIGNFVAQEIIKRIPSLPVAPANSTDNNTSRVSKTNNQDIPHRGNSSGTKTFTESISDYLSKLNDLKQSGVLTNDEYESKRNEFADKLFKRLKDHKESGLLSEQEFELKRKALADLML